MDLYFHLRLSNGDGIMSTELSLKEVKKEWHGSVKSYVIGFIASLLLTVLSFALVAFRLISEDLLIHTLTGLALIQATFQLRFFLHLGQEAKPQWETLIFYLMIVVLLIIALGSLWIIFDLNHRVMGDMTKAMAHD